ncbi:hypothetical protein [Lutibacter sp.]|uniref:hypothetical protein n=1 Tax=Lutibacter sp. TaxID=1925666 RepID=UPI0025C0E7A6|nr:hypothetical protein [Lutibacter sp.]MCF6181537.1 hypothetical protein [Lutibacter sp.]
MKKKYLLLIALITCVGFLNAQKADLNGVWKLTESIQYGDQTRTYVSYLTFKDSGVIEFAGRDVGTWLKNESENTLTIKCDQFQAIDGVNKIETLDEKELKLLNSKDETTILQRIGLPKGKELNNKFTGEWLLEKQEKDGKTDFVGVIMDLNSNGIFYTQGFIFGTWDYNNTTKAIFFDTKKLNGEYSILESNKTSFILDVKSAKTYFSKIDHEKIAKENGASGLIGTWRLSDEENPDAVHILKFNAPDKFVYVEKTEYSTSTSNGMWLFNKSEKTVILLGRLEKLSGLNKVIAITNNQISLENNGTIYSFKKEAQQVVKIEHLTFTQDDFYTKAKDGEESEFKYSDDEQKLPWKDPMKMMMTLVNVKHLVYNYATLIQAVDVFENETLTADVNSNPQEQQLSIDFIFNGYDRYNLPEDAGLPPNEFDAYNKLYPEEDNSFRVVGSEKITTPAGTFNCTVIEAVDGFDRSKKLWMINDKPGIYAKIIDENRAKNYGYYHIYELQEIKE